MVIGLQKEKLQGGGGGIRSPPQPCQILKSPTWTGGGNPLPTPAMPDSEKPGLFWVKDVRRRKKLTTDFFELVGWTTLVGCDYFNS